MPSSGDIFIDSLSIIGYGLSFGTYNPWVIFFVIISIIVIIVLIVKYAKKEGFSYVWRSIEQCGDRTPANNLPPQKPHCKTPNMVINSEAVLDNYMAFLEGSADGTPPEKIIYDVDTHPVYVDSNCLDDELRRTTCMSCSVEKCRKVL